MHYQHIVSTHCTLHPATTNTMPASFSSRQIKTKKDIMCKFPRNRKIWTELNNNHPRNRYRKSFNRKYYINIQKQRFLIFINEPNKIFLFKMFSGWEIRNQLDRFSIKIRNLNFFFFLEFSFSGLLNCDRLIVFMKIMCWIPLWNESGVAFFKRGIIFSRRGEGKKKKGKGIVP